MPGRAFRHLARANNQDALTVERTEDLLSQFDSRIADRYRVLPDIRFRADALGYRKGARQYGIQHRADRSLLPRLVVSLL